MRICIGGKNNIAVDVCSYILEYYPELDVYAIPNKNDDGKDGFQRSFKKFAEERQVPIVSLSDVYPWEDLVFVSVEFDRIIRPEKFASTQLFNIHFSLLPKYKGCHTAAMPILNGENLGGVTFHLMERGIDTGDIIDQEKIYISKNETCRSLYLKYLSLGSKVVKRNLDAVLDNRYVARPQAVEGSTYFSRTEIDYSNIQIDFNRTAAQIDRQFRAYSFRDFQLPKYEEIPISYIEFTLTKSTEKPGVKLDETDDAFKVATIDYDVILHKDKLNELIDMVSAGKFDELMRVKDLNRYTNEQEPIHGWTLLMVAAYNCQYDIAKYLLKLGSDINARNYNGTSVIMYAKNGMLSTGDDRLFKYLLGKGANPFIKDYMGKDLFCYIEEPIRIKVVNSTLSDVIKQ